MLECTVLDCTTQRHGAFFPARRAEGGPKGSGAGGIRGATVPSRGSRFWIPPGWAPCACAGPGPQGAGGRTEPRGDSGASRRLGPRLARAVQAPHTGRGPGGGCRGPGGCRPSRQSRAAWWQPFLGGARGSQLSQGRRELVWGPARRPPTPAPTAAPGLCALGPSAAPTRSLVGPWSPRSPGHCRLRKPGTTAGLQDGSLTQESTLFRAKGT